MSSFTSIPSVKLLVNGQWRNEEAFAFYFYDPDGVSITVPKGFVHDFASIPKIFRIFLSPTDPRWAKAAILHDYIYRNKPDNPLTQKPFTRRQADVLFYEGVLILGTAKKLASILLFAVRVGGWIYWKK